MKWLGLQGFVCFALEHHQAGATEGGTSTIDSLNALIAQSSGEVYTGGTGVIVRAPDFITDDPTKVVPGTFWSNDIVAPSQFYPTQSNVWFPNSGSDGYMDITFQSTDQPEGPWSYASMGVVVGTSMEKLYPNDFANIQAEDWGWGVFYPTDSNAVDQRCQRLDDRNGYDCPGGFLDDNGGFSPDSSSKGSGNYKAGSATALGQGFGGGAGCHFDNNANTVDQPDASVTNLVGNANCECEYLLKGDGGDWSDWVTEMVQHLQQKSDFQDRQWLGPNSQGKAPGWAIDSTVCWVSNPRDLIKLQNQLYWRRNEWNNGMVPQTDLTSGDSEQIRKYWGWNEIPVDREIVENDQNWDSIMVKLPADLCNDGSWGGSDSISCLGQKEKVALEADIDSFVQNGKLLTGYDNVGSHPGSDIVVVREWGAPFDDHGGVNWSKWFFCEDAVIGKYKITSDDPAGNGACYLDWASSPGPGPSPPGPTPSPPPAPTPSPPAEGDHKIQHKASGKCLGVQDSEVFNGNNLVVVDCDGSSAQQWSFPNDGSGTLVSESDTLMCADTPGGETGWNGVFLEVWECNGHPGQQFGYDDQMGTIYAWTESDASFCFDVPGAGQDVNTVVWLWGCTGGDNQEFSWFQSGAQFVA